MFEDIKVLSFTHFLQGPSAVQMLADLGADGLVKDGAQDQGEHDAAD